MIPTIYIYGVVLIWLVTVSFFLVRMTIHYRNLTSNVSKKDLLSSLNNLISISERNTRDIEQVTKMLNEEVSENKKHIQRMGFKRYNPFTDTGGDQSFTIALLDDLGDGIMVSSLHSRENTRLYAKKVSGGKVEGQALSSEEQEVIKQSFK